jgi:hypothetical protein
MAVLMARGGAAAAADAQVHGLVEGHDLLVLVHGVEGGL